MAPIPRNVSSLSTSIEGKVPLSECVRKWENLSLDGVTSATSSLFKTCQINQKIVCLVWKFTFHFYIQTRITLYATDFGNVQKWRLLKWLTVGNGGVMIQLPIQTLSCLRSVSSVQTNKEWQWTMKHFMLRSLHPYFMTFVYRITLVISWLTCAICASNYCPLKVIIMLRVKQQFCPGLSWTWSGKG